MLTHYIILSSSYSMGKRIALHYIVDETTEYEKLKDVVFKITSECGKDVSISTHFVQTDSVSWDSVYEKDHFFKDVKLIDNIDEFIKIIKKDRTLKGIDIAKYILCKVKCTHLKIEKLTYLCYADYLCQYGDKLYKDKIFAYKYGPVVKSVYDKCKIYGYDEIKNEDDILEREGLEMPDRSRILFAEDGTKKIESVEKTISKYGNLSAGELVDITHRPMTPWSMSGKGTKKDEIITDEVIISYHCNEEI